MCLSLNLLFETRFHDVTWAVLERTITFPQPAGILGVSVIKGLIGMAAAI